MEILALMADIHKLMALKECQEQYLRRYGRCSGPCLIPLSTTVSAKGLKATQRDLGHRLCTRPV